MVDYNCRNYFVVAFTHIRAILIQFTFILLLCVFFDVLSVTKPMQNFKMIALQLRLVRIKTDLQTDIGYTYIDFIIPIF